MLNLDIAADHGDFQLKVDCKIELHGITAIFGPSGSGKTTLLRSIAGLQPVVGNISINGTSWLDSSNRINVPARKRSIGYMSQRPMLFPHFSVRKNLAFVEKQSRRRRTIEVKVDELVAELELEPLLDRDPANLSGGELSRVAIARSLLAGPELLLLDEPLGSIDVDRKADVIPYIQTVTERHRIPALFVSHSIDEVVTLCPQTLVLSGGVNVALSDTNEILRDSSIEEVLGRAEAGAVVNAKVVAHDVGFQLTTIQFGNNKLLVPELKASAIGEAVHIRIKARDVSIATQKPQKLSIRNVLRGDITAIEEAPNSPYASVQVNCDGTSLRAQVTRAAIEDLSIVEGNDVFVLVKSVTLES